MQIKYPDLNKAKIIAFDIETHDPDLEELGPGVFRKDGGFILGVGIATDTFAEYYNLAHYDCTKEEREKNLQYLDPIMRLEIPKVGTHIIYDLDWWENWLGKKVNGLAMDIEIAEALLDENQKHYSLDFQSNKYLGEGKYTEEIDNFCRVNNLKGKSIKHLSKMPYELVRKYVLTDVNNPLAIFKIQEKLLKEQDLYDLFIMECELTKLLLYMRKIGVRIDPDKRDNNALKVQNRLEELQIKTWAEHGQFNYNSSLQVSKILDKLSISYPKTNKGNPSITSDFLKEGLEKQDDHTIDYDNIKSTIYELRKADKILSTFLLGSFVRFVTVNDLIHCSFYNTLNDEYGTRSGRFSSANPNLQQIPSLGVDEFWGTVCREIFIPFENCWWMKFDYSQIEYRFMAHFARGPGGEEVRRAYSENPDIDYHQYIMDLTNLKRRFAKNLNFGVAYGMGAKHMAKFFGWELDYCYNILNVYHESAPYIKTTIKEVEKVAQRRGYIKTFLKRRSRLIDKDKAYIMFCRLIQGSAADLLKKAMLDCYKAGIFSVLHPHLTVHDELDVSTPKNKKGLEAAKEMKYIMEHCIELKVPVKTEVEFGESWAQLMEFNPEQGILF